MEDDKNNSAQEINKKKSENDIELSLPQNLEFLNSEFNDEESEATNQDNNVGIELVEKAPDKNFDSESKRKKIKIKDQQDFNFFEENEFEYFSSSFSENGLQNIDFINNIYQTGQGKDSKIISKKTVRQDSCDFSSFEKTQNLQIFEKKNI